MYPMKSLFAPHFIAVTFSVLAGVVQAEQFSAPVQMRMQPLTPLLYTAELYRVPAPAHKVDKPTERAVTVPAPLVIRSLAPTFPNQDRRASHDSERGAAIRGQSRTLDEVSAILDQPPPVARGAVDADAVDPKLLDNINSSELQDILLPADPASHTKPDVAEPGSASASLGTDPLGNAVLLFVMSVTTIALVWMIFVAYDYRQRWMQSLTAQNDRYLGGGYDMEMEDAYRDYSSGAPAC